MTIPYPTAVSTLNASSRYPVESPMWWVTRLHTTLAARQRDLDRFDAYYRGHPPMPQLPLKAQEEFYRLLKMSRSNYMGLVVDSKAERIAVEGFRVGKSPAADGELWRIWQANCLDSDMDQAFVEAMIGGCAYLLVAPNPADQATPVITIEHAAQAVVEYVPGSRRRAAAGLKVWADDWTGRLLATLYLPAMIYKWQAGRQIGAAPQWEPRDGQDFESRNPLGVLPLVEMPNNPRLLSGGVSELDDLVDVQDRVNKTILDRMLTQDVGAFPQWWATGYPTQDEQGNPAQPIDRGRDRLVSTDVSDAKFGQWDAAPLDPYSGAKREDVKDIASRSRTPAQYLLGEMSNVNGETLKAAESGLVAAVLQRRRYFGEGIEQAMNVALLAAGQPQDPSMETLWRDPEFRTEGERVDALVKMSTLGVPPEELWRRWGATPQEVERWKQMQQMSNPLGQLQATLAAQAASPMPVDPAAL